MPASVVLNHRDGRYAIDSDNEKDKFADKNILTWMVRMRRLVMGNDAQM